MKKQAAGQRNMRQGRGLGRPGGAQGQNSAQAKKGQLPNLRDIPPSEQGKWRTLGVFYQKNAFANLIGKSLTNFSLCA